MSEQILTSESKRLLLEKYLQGRAEQLPTATAAIPRRDVSEPAPLSYEQEQIWLHAQMAPDVPMYNEPLTILYKGALDTVALERSFNEIIKRHEIWRTSFEIVDGKPIQIVNSCLDVSLPLMDLRHLSADHREREAVRIATEDAGTPLDLTKIPLFKARLVQVQDDDFRLYLTLSHMIFDGVAVYRVLLPELAALYESFTKGKTASLPPLQIQYADYACWERQTMQPDQSSNHINYWRKQLAGELPVLEFPTNRPRAANRTFRGSMYSFSLDEKLTANLRAFCREYGFTLFQTLLAGFAALLSRYCGQQDIPIGSVTAGRKHPDTQALLGYFINTIVLRIDLSANPAFTELVSRVRNLTLEAMEHDSVPFGYLLTQLDSQRDPNYSPLFQVLFSLEVALPNLDPAWTMTQMDIDSGAAKFDLYIQLEERPDRILARFQYSTDVFDRDSITQIASHWTTLLNGAMAEPTRRLASLPLMGAQELAQLADWNKTKESYPPITISELFEAQVCRSPNAIAAVVEDEWLSYAELNARANQLARHLRNLGVGPEVLVGLCVERSLEMVVALIAILKAGGAFIPLDPALPRDRLSIMLADAKPRVVLTQQALQERLPIETEIVFLDPEWKTFSVEKAENLQQHASPQNLAYVIYTSGSTGAPKGVQIEHRSVVNFLVSMQREPGICSADILLSVTTLSFDIAYLEIFLPLISGARLVVAGSEDVRDGFQLMTLLEQCKATVMQATPATWRLLIEAGWQGSSGMKILCGGETLPPKLAQELLTRASAVWNLYGPTETTIWVSAHRVSGKDAALPIGRPIANSQIHVLDSQLNLTPAAVVGEVYIAGECLARGYLKRPELTAANFLASPFSSGERLYKTGDLARRLPDGSIVVLGRTDHQVKIRGFRVELGSIETYLSQHPGVKGVIAALRETSPGDSQLVAYVLLREHAAATADELREFLKQKLPQYMLPAYFVFLDRFPLTSNGKVDRRAMPPPHELQHKVEDGFVAPRDDLERRLTDIWKEVLRTERIGIRDDFFALGGHSLLAVRLFAMIKTTMGKTIPLATLLKAPTIELLADALREKQEPAGWFSFVPIQREGSRPPLFCISSQFGDVLLYRSLAQLLGREQPFYALQVFGQSGLPRRHTIESMATEYLREVRKIQPTGPYFFCGYCFGGRVALEMAQQLIAQGEQPPYLGLFVTYHVLISTLSERIRLHVRQFRVMGTKAKLAYAAQNFADKTKSLVWRTAYKLFRDVAPDSSPLFRNVAEMNLNALRCYMPRTYPGQMIVFMSGKVPSGFQSNPTVRLKEYLYDMDASKVELRIVPGEADTMFREPFVNVLADHLRTSLEQSMKKAGLVRPA